MTTVVGGPTIQRGLAERMDELLRPAAFAHPAADTRLIETHISWVILVGSFAYKIKKPVNLGFLDFTTCEQRRADCEDEVRLNRRLCPDVYLGVANPGPLAGAPGYPWGTSRPGSDLYTDSVVKLSPRGKLLWYYQLTRTTCMTGTCRIRRC